MKYTLQKSFYTECTTIEIDKKAFENLKQAKKCLSNALAIEEKYEILLANYLDLEKEYLSITTEHMLRSHSPYTDLFDIRLAFNRRIVNLLTSTKLYYDHIQRNVNNCLPEEVNIANKIKVSFSNEYDSYFEYRFMEALRNYVQHQGLAVHYTGVNAQWTSRDKNGELKYSTKFLTYKSEVESDNAFKKQVSSEMPDKVDLMFSSRVYIESFSKVHCYIRGLISSVSESSRALISQSIQEYEEAGNSSSLGLFAVCTRQEKQLDETVEKIPLMLDLDGIRIDLIKKNPELTNLRKRFVSSSVL